MFGIAAPRNGGPKPWNSSLCVLLRWSLCPIPTFSSFRLTRVTFEQLVIRLGPKFANINTAFVGRLTLTWEPNMFYPFEQFEVENCQNNSCHISVFFRSRKKTEKRAIFGPRLGRVSVILAMNLKASWKICNNNINMKNRKSKSLVLKHLHPASETHLNCTAPSMSITKCSIRGVEALYPHLLWLNSQCSSCIRS